MGVRHELGVVLAGVDANSDLPSPEFEAGLTGTGKVVAFFCEAGCPPGAIDTLNTAPGLMGNSDTETPLPFISPRICLPASCF